MSKYPDYLSPNATPTKLGKSQKSRARREPSGVFSLFQAPQIQQFKEAFQLIDHDKDGWVNENDLREIFASLGEYEECDDHLLNRERNRDLTIEKNDGRVAEGSSWDTQPWDVLRRDREGNQLYDVPNDDERASV